jgi:hypothetical protein
MIESRFDPSHQVRFDLGRGVVELSGRTPQLLVPLDALLQLCRGAGDEMTWDFGRQIGTEIGRRISERFGGDVANVSSETMVDHLGGELALIGLGSMLLERWGQVLLLAFSDAPAEAEGAALVSAAVEGALQRATSRDVRAFVLEHEGRDLRIALVSAAAAAKLKEWQASGAAFAQLVAQLNNASRGAA